MRGGGPSQLQSARLMAAVAEPGPRPLDTHENFTSHVV